jgi:ribonuclease Y
MDPLSVVLIIALLVAIAAVVLVALRGRGRSDGGVSQDALRAMLAETLADQRTSTDHASAAAGDELVQRAVAEADSVTAEAAKQTDALRQRARAEAERMHSEALADAERILRAARSEAAALRENLDSERARIAQEGARALAADRASLTDERDRVAEATRALSQEQQTLAADRERVRADRAELARLRDELATRERTLHDETARLAALQAEMDGRSADLSRAETQLHVQQEAELTRISGLTVDDARAELLSRQEESVRRDAALLIRRVESEAQATAKQRARAIVADAIQRVASDQTSQSVVSVVQLPADDIKGRIIGREGRNIRTFETVTGVNVIIDDTPEAVLLSCFDPVRREVGRLTLESLIEDGRIHPHRIEEAFERATEEVDALCQRAAEDALLAVGISDLHPELVALVGRLKYRTSYGQNVLGHLVETSHIARAMAAELGVDPAPVARGAFLHDIGKALTHEVQGSHALIGADLARRYGESAEVVHCIEAHHDEVPPATVEAVLTQAADACSGGRPGARRESLESYVQRLEHIEAIASAKKGVEKVFAMQAGRELRVMVKPDVVDDLEAHVLAREVAKQIEEELTYPGQVRVTVIRESRATEVAR